MEYKNILYFLRVYLVCLAIFYTVQLLTLHKVDYISAILLIKNNMGNTEYGRKVGTLSKLFYIVKKLTKILIFKPIDHVSAILHISYSYFTINQYYNDIFKSATKVYWYEFCKTYGLNHPKLYIYVVDGKVEYLNNIKNEDEYIIKPNFGSWGIGVELKKGYEIIKSIQNNDLDNVVVQEKLSDCYVNNKARHFRYLTTYNNEVSLLYKLKQDSPDEIVSNYNSGGIPNYCRNLYCDDLSEEENSILSEYLDKLKDIHNKDMKHIFAIGWDLMFDCSDDVNKIYVLEGNFVPDGSWVEWRNDADLYSDIKKYKDSALSFYENNIDY
jgi:glutathione synthase/RimK-type ligase-like ATP-grasp enzyme